MLTAIRLNIITTGRSAEVARLIWDEKVAGSIPVAPTYLIRYSMEVFTVQEWEENFDELFARVENGETIGVINEDGKAAVFAPADDPILNLYTDHDEAS